VVVGQVEAGIERPRESEESEPENQEKKEGLEQILFQSTLHMPRRSLKE
jgi:hypothetical protein